MVLTALGHIVVDRVVSVFVDYQILDELQVLTIVMNNNFRYLSTIWPAQLRQRVSYHFFRQRHPKHLFFVLSGRLQHEIGNITHFHVPLIVGEELLGKRLVFLSEMLSEHLGFGFRLRLQHHLMLSKVFESFEHITIKY